jgi:glutamyl-tRNA reductase
VEDMARGREIERERVEEIITEETAEFMVWLRTLEAVPVVSRLKQKHEQIRQAELNRLRNQLPDLPDHAWEKIEAAMGSLVNRVGKDPIEKIKAAVSAEDKNMSASLLDAARELFGLTAADPPDVAGSAGNPRQPKVKPSEGSSQLVTEPVMVDEWQIKASAETVK